MNKSDLNSPEIPYSCFDLRTLTILKTLSKSISLKASEVVDLMNVGNELLEDLIRHKDSQAEIIQAYTDIQIMEIIKSIHSNFGDRIYIIGYRLHDLNFTATFQKVGATYSVTKQKNIFFAGGIQCDLKELIETIRTATASCVYDDIHELRNLFENDHEYVSETIWYVEGWRNIQDCIF